MRENHKRQKNKRIGKPALQKVVKESYDNTQIKSLIDKTKQKKQKQDTQNKFYYSFLTIILLVCLAQIGFGAILNISKAISYQRKISTIKESMEDAEMRNKMLKDEIKNFSSAKSLEAIARNNLKMAAANEVLVIINDDKNKDVEALPKHKKNILDIFDKKRENDQE